MARKKSRANIVVAGVLIAIGLLGTWLVVRAHRDAEYMLVGRGKVVNVFGFGEEACGSCLGPKRGLIYYPVLDVMGSDGESLCVRIDTMSITFSLNYGAEIWFSVPVDCPEDGVPRKHASLRAWLVRQDGIDWEYDSKCSPVGYEEVLDGSIGARSNALELVGQIDVVVSSGEITSATLNCETKSAVSRDDAWLQHWLEHYRSSYDDPGGRIDTVGDTMQALLEMERRAPGAAGPAGVDLKFKMKRKGGELPS